MPPPMFNESPIKLVGSPGASPYKLLASPAPV